MIALAAVALATATVLPAAESFRLVTYNLENYIDTEAGDRPVKSAEARAKIRESLLALKPDVLAVEEMGALSALRELQASLKAQGLDLPHHEFVTGWDTNIHVAVLSRFPIIARRSHTNLTYLLAGKRFTTSRGFGEIDIQVSPQYRFTLFNCHLKSKRTIAEADEAEMREQEALQLREKIDERLKANPQVNLAVMGDFNDTKDARSTRAILGRRGAATGLVDTRPAERNGDNTPSSNPRWDPRNIAWTHFFGKEDTYSRIDYILLSAGMAREWVTNESHVLALPNWGVASDHRPVLVTITAQDK
jgi:endonuclease/exonuclease/phosphatase family metal-dependent hydrolase